MVKEGLVKFKWCSGCWELRKAGGRSSYGEFLRRPDSLRACRGQEGGLVVPLGLFDCFEVGGPGSPSRGKKGCVESVRLGGAEGGTVSFPEMGEELCPPGL